MPAMLLHDEKRSCSLGWTRNNTSQTIVIIGIIIIILIITTMIINTYKNYRSLPLFRPRFMTLP